jgi:PRTRC genetic system protein B
MPHGVLPDNFWYSDPRRGAEKYIWSNPPGKRGMFFSKSLGIPEGEYNVPGIVYVATDSSLHIYAYKGEKLKPDSALYKGPFFNTTDGRVCLGTSSLKKPLNPTYTELAEYWEKRFWLTEFTHLGGSENPTKNNLVMVTKDSADKPFDEKELLSAGKKLKDLF